MRNVISKINNVLEYNMGLCVGRYSRQSDKE